MKLHLPIGLRKALMAVFAVLATSPAMAAEQPNVVQNSNFTTGEVSEWKVEQVWVPIYKDYGYWKEVKTPSAYFPDSLEMNGTTTNRIETGLLGSKKYVVTGPWNDQSFTVEAKGNVTMSTNGGVNIISGNAAEIRGALTTIINSSYGGLMEWLAEQVLPEVEFAPTVKATGEVLVDGLESGKVLMDGPANAVMLGSTVEGKYITMQNSGDQITSAGALMDGLMYSTLETIGNLKEDAPAAIRAKLAPLNQFQGNFNIVQGSNIGTADTVKVKMDASLVGKTIPDGVDPLAANIILGDSHVTAQDIELTGMASVITNTKMSDAADALASNISTLGTSDLGAMKDLLNSVLNSGVGTSVTATTGNINIGSEFNLLHGGNFEEDGQALVLNATNLTYNEKGEAVTGLVNIEGFANVVSGNVQMTAGEINMTGEFLKGDLPGMVDGIISGLAGQIPGGATIVDTVLDKGNFNVVTGGATLNATGNINLSSELDDFEQASAINAVLDTELVDVMGVMDGNIDPMLQGGRDTTLTAGGDINLLGRVNVVNGFSGNVKVDASGNVNMQGNISMVSGNSTVTGKTININTVEGDTYKMHLNAEELQDILPVSDRIANAIANMGMVNAAVVAGGANLTSEGVDEKGNGITIGGTVGLLMNTPVADAIKELNPLNPGKNPSEFEIAKSLLQKGEATTLTAEKGNILVGSQFNLMHGGNFTFKEGTNEIDRGKNSLVLNAKAGDINVEGTANVVSGNVEVYAKDINLTGEVLPDSMSTAAGSLVGILTSKMGMTSATGVLNKLVEKGSVNMVTGGAMLDATGNITMTAKSVDDVGKIGNINAVIDTEIVDVLDAKDGDFGSLVNGGGYTTTLNAGGNINLEGRVNLVNGTYVELNAGKNVDLQGNISMIGGATVNAGTLANAEANIKEIKGDININTSEDKKYKMYIDSSDLGDIELPLDADTTAALANTGVNAAIVAGGAKLNATQDINIGGTAGLVVNTPATAVMDAVMTLMDNQKVSELLLAEGVLNAGVGTTLNADRNINLGADLNLVHGGNFSDNPKKPTALVITAGNAVNVQGTANVVSGNVQVNADTINMTGERLTGNMADVAGALADSLVGGLVGDIPGADIMLDKLVNKGSVNVVTGGATLTAKNGITMSSVHETGAINAVLDTELTDLLETVRTGESTGLVTGGYKPTTLIAENGDITMEGRLNLVNGGMVTLKAEKGTVNLNGSLSFIGGDATVTAQNIKLNDDETGKYQMYFDSEELGAILPAGSPITELMNTFGVTDLLGTTGVNAALVAGGSNLTATGDITTGGTVSMLVNTPMTEVMKELETWTEIKDETWMVSQLLQTGTATTVQADGNINLASRLNLMHGGNMGNANAALKLTAGNDVKMSGTANVVSGNVIVNAENDILMKGEPLKFDTGDALDGVTGGEMLSKLAAQGSTNIVTGGATLEATNNIKLDSMANLVLDTQASNVVDAFMKQDLSFLEKGGNKLTSLNAGGNIDLVGRLNVVNGAYVALNAGKDVNISGTLNMVSGKAKVNAEGSINITGQTSVGLNWDEIIPGVVGGYAEDMGITDKLNKGVNGSFVLGGATLTAKEDIKLSGKASVVTNVPLGSAFEALTTKLEETWQPEIWLMKDMLNDGVATTLTADGNIEMDSRLNVLHGGNMGNADAALVLTAGQDVKIAGTANIISGNTQVTGKNITVTGKTSAGFDWDQIADALPGKYAGYGELAGDMGILAKLEKGVNGSVIAGGATLTATTGDITMEGMATAVVDVTVDNVLEAVETMNGTPIMEGGAEDTLIKAENGSINLNSRLNLVNGGQVTLDAGQNVNMNGTFNTVSGNANVIAGGDINMNAQNKVGVDISPMLDGHYADIAKDLGMADVLKNGVSSNIVAGGANLQAEGDVKMSGVATAIVDTTASNVIGAVKGENLGELMKGGKSTTEVKAKGNIELASQMNLVNGGNTKNAGGVLLDAGKDVIVGGQVSVVNRAEIKAGQNVNFNSGNTVVKYSDIAAGKVAFTGETAEITDVKFNNASVDVLGTHLVNTLRSEVAMNNLNVADMGSIENLGTLSLKDATLSGATLYNAGSIIVSNTMTLESATLSFVADENNVTLNHTAIVLGDGFKTLVDGSGDMLAGLHFELNYGALDFIADDSNVFNFKLALFEGITEAQTGLLDAALADGEFSITLTNGFRVDGYENVDIVWENNVAYVTGSASVPEPTTATLSLLALAALAARRRRK